MHYHAALFDYDCPGCQVRHLSDYARVDEVQYAGIFNDPGYCLTQLRVAREIFGDRRTTEEQYDACGRAVTLILLHGPESVVETARATLLEMGYRRWFFEKLWGNKP